MCSTHWAAKHRQAAALDNQLSLVASCKKRTIKLRQAYVCILWRIGCWDFNFLPTNGFSTKPLKVKRAESNRVFIYVSITKEASLSCPWDSKARLREFGGWPGHKTKEISAPPPPFDSPLIRPLPPPPACVPDWQLSSFFHSFRSRRFTLRSAFCTK